jgi:hypothetical protein
MEAWAENPDAAAFTGLVLPYELATDAQILFEQRGGFRRGFEKIRYGQVLPGNPYTLWSRNLWSGLQYGFSAGNFTKNRWI